MPTLMGLDKVFEINKLFAEINRQKMLLVNLPELEDQYQKAVNELYELDLLDSLGGEELSAKAIDLGKRLEEATKAQDMINQLESDLMNRYGFLPAEEQAA